MAKAQLIKPGTAVKLTQSVVDRLDQAIMYDQQKNRAEALKVLASLKPDVDLLHKATSLLEEYADATAGNHQRLSNQVEILIGDIATQEKNLRQLIDTAQHQVAGNKARYADLKKHCDDLNREIDKLNNEVREIRGRLEEAATWCWVPGYGQYLAGRTIVDAIDGKIGKLANSGEEFKRLLNDRNATTIDLEKAKKILDELNEQVAVNSKLEAQLKKQSKELQAKNKILASYKAFAMEVKQFYAMVGLSLGSIEDNLKNVKIISGRLSEIITTYDDTGKKVNITVMEALTNVGIALENFRQAKGETVHTVYYSMGGEKLGTFFNYAAGKWVETKEYDQNVKLNFVEKSRDEWSVFLYDSSRDVTIQLDLWMLNIYITDKSVKNKEIYSIIDVSERVPAWKAVTVEYKVDNMTGTFTSVLNKEWLETMNLTMKFRFVETNRDEWSIYLHDKKRDCKIRLDLWTNMIRYTDKNNDFDLYTITGVS